MGPDNIQPKLLKLAGGAIIPSLESLHIDTAYKPKLSLLVRKQQKVPQFSKRTSKRIGVISMLSIPSKILESLVNDALVRHSFKENAELISDKQLAYRAGSSTELLLIHPTETWRRAVDSG